MKTLIVLSIMLLGGCSTIEYSVTVPIMQSQQSIGTVTLQPNQVNVSYRQTYFNFKAK